MSNQTAEPITTGWKISQVIQRYPALLDVLIDTAPAFEKLRNPLLRKVQSRLVTVGQAAGVAGLEPAFLVNTLNAAAGLESPAVEAPAPETAQAESPPPWVQTVPVTEHLDVRAYQERGEEPFSAIMAVSRKTGDGQAFAIRNTFEPAPLYAVLGQRGFEHWTRQLGENDWEVFFFKSGLRHEPATPAPAPGAIAESTWDEPTSTMTIDVSELVPPEPLVRILTALEELPDGASLLVHHVRRPMHLYPRLDELGYRHETRDLGPDRVEVLIEKTVAGGEPA